MKKYNDKELSEILDKLSDEMKNTLIRMLLKYDRKNVDIISEPIYNYIKDTNGTVLGQTIAGVNYGISVFYKSEEYRKREFVYRISYVDGNYLYHTVDTNKDDFENTIYKIFNNGGFEVKITCIEK